MEEISLEWVSSRVISRQLLIDPEGGSQVTKEFSLRQEILLWNPFAILIFLGLITIEWIVRKFADLS